MDFDAESHRLLFSRETENLTYSHQAEQGTSHNVQDEDEQGCTVGASRIRQLREETITRLAGQALPAQVKLLELCGAANTHIRSISTSPKDELRKLSVSDLKSHIAAFGSNTDGCVEKTDLIQRLRTAAGDPIGLVAWWAAVKLLEPPQCVCGSSLRRVTGLQRVRRIVQSLMPDCPPGSPSYESLLTQLIDEGEMCICDLCDKSLTVKTGVWTCENGDSTILHATAYDVCDACFVKHAIAGLDPGVSELGKSKADNKTGTSEAAPATSEPDGAEPRFVQCPLCQQKFLAKSEDDCTNHFAACMAFAERHGGSSAQASNADAAPRKT